MLKRNTGLYISYNNKGQIRKTIVTAKGETYTENSTIAKELLSFLNMSLAPFTEVAEYLNDISANVEIDDPDHFGEVDLVAFQELLKTTVQVIEVFEEENIFHGTLLRTLMEDAVPPDDGSAMYIYQTKLEILKRLDAILQTQHYIELALQMLCEKKEFSIAKDFPMLDSVETVQILSMDKVLRAEYYFRSPCNYYCYLFLMLLNKKPNVARCQCCGDYFIPKTKKVTLYCDRVIKNGKTCKQIAPHLKRRINAENDKVLKAYERTKQKMYTRYERASCSLDPLPHGLSWQEYTNWIDLAGAAKAKYLLGKITTEEALEIIEVKD